MEDLFFGLKLKSGIDFFPLRHWETLFHFIKNQSWYFDTPVLEADKSDPLLNQKYHYGAFMLGFDFHLTHMGPRLIEINTNAGGLATLMALQPEDDRNCTTQSFVDALLQEYKNAGKTNLPSLIAIVDDNILGQAFYPEMQYFAKLLKARGLPTILTNPQDLSLSNNSLTTAGKKIDLVYNRLTDFRLLEESHALLRQAALDFGLVVTPHPQAYARIADKRNLIKIKDPVVPETKLLQDAPLEFWLKDRKNWVFKPVDRAGSKGVYRGDKISLSKLKTLPPDTLVQKMIPPPQSEDGSKYDVRIYTCGTKILGLASRHYSGQVMEMSTDLSGFKLALPEGFQSFRELAKAYDL